MISKKLSGKIITGLFAAMVGVAGVQGVTHMQVIIMIQHLNSALSMAVTSRRK